jgi:hypothetical protein
MQCTRDRLSRPLPPGESESDYSSDFSIRDLLFEPVSDGRVAEAGKQTNLTLLDSFCFPVAFPSNRLSLVFWRGSQFQN